MALTPEQQEDANYLERLGEWDENRVWLDGEWWEIEHWGKVTDWVCEDVVMRRMDPQPTSLLAGQQDGGEGGGRLSEEDVQVLRDAAWQMNEMTSLAYEYGTEEALESHPAAAAALRALLALTDRLAPAPADGTGGADAGQ